LFNIEGSPQKVNKTAVSNRLTPTQ